MCNPMVSLCTLIQKSEPENALSPHQSLKSHCRDTGQQSCIRPKSWSVYSSWFIFWVRIWTWWRSFVNSSPLSFEIRIIASKSAYCSPEEEATRRLLTSSKTFKSENVRWYENQGWNIVLGVSIYRSERRGHRPSSARTFFLRHPIHFYWVKFISHGKWLPMSFILFNLRSFQENHELYRVLNPTKWWDSVRPIGWADVTFREHLVLEVERQLQIE
jgi:hypothetical protein